MYKSFKRGSLSKLSQVELAGIGGGAAAEIWGVDDNWGSSLTITGLALFKFISFDSGRGMARDVWGCC